MFPIEMKMWDEQKRRKHPHGFHKTTVKFRSEDERINFRISPIVAEGRNTSECHRKGNGFKVSCFSLSLLQVLIYVLSCCK